MMQYGNILSLGIDVPPNFNEAEKYLKAAADKCNVDAIILYDSHLKRKWFIILNLQLFDSCLFNRFVCACVLYFTVNNVKSGTLQHLSGLVHSIIKFEATNDVPRFKKACETRMKAIKNHLPFIPKDSKCTFSEIENWINDEELFERALSEVISKTS